MILRETQISECWCPNCHNGQMGQIHQILFEEKITVKELIGRKITCQHCGIENELEDVIILMPVEFYVATESQKSKAKSNNELFKWLQS